jgi:hypothetical protein
MAIRSLYFPYYDKSRRLRWAIVSQANTVLPTAASLSQQPTFLDRYARAREAQADALFDDILSIADDGRNDWMERRGEEDAGWVANGENIRRAQLRIDARKWMAGKLRPKKYGEKLDIDGTLTHEAGDSIKSLMDAVNGRTRSK